MIQKPKSRPPLDHFQSDTINKPDIWLSGEDRLSFALKEITVFKITGEIGKKYWKNVKAGKIKRLTKH